MSDALQNLRIVNFGWIWAGPVFGHLFADFGAEVIKVESNQRLDYTRRLPPYLHDVPNQSLYGHNTYRNQLSISLELSTARGQALARELVRQSDIVAENFQPGTLQKLGLDYQELCKVKPDLIMISLSTAGQTGPLRDIVTLGSAMASLTGVDSLQGYLEDGAPLPVGTANSDPLSGVFGVIAVLAALRHRRLTGQGQYIDMSQWEASTTLMSGPILDYTMNQRVWGVQDNLDMLMAPHNVYPCQGGDSWVSIAVGSEEEWQGLCRAMGEPGWRREERFADAFNRLRHRRELDSLIEVWTRQRTSWEAARALQKEGVAAFPALSTREVYEDGHYAERECWVNVEHPHGRESIYGVHWKMSKSPGSVRQPAPLLGQHNDYVFCELLGLSQAQSDELKAAKVIY